MQSIPGVSALVVISAAVFLGQLEVYGCRTHAERARTFRIYC